MHNIKMQVSAGVTANDFLHALQRGCPLRGLLAQDRDQSMFASKTVPEIYAEFQAAVVRSRDLLQQYVDEWLNSAFIDGVEEPLSRHPGKLSGSAVDRYLKAYPPSVFRTDGQLALIFAPLRMRKDKHPAEDAELEAARHFTLLLDAPWKFKLFKCRRCNQYGFLNNNPRPAVYKRGMHCENCRNKVSARASTERNNEDLQRKRKQLAIAAWRKWKARNGDRKRWIVTEVNSGLHPMEGRITVN